MNASMTNMGWNLAAVAAMMLIGWCVSLLYRNVTIVDSLWGLGFVLIAWLTYVMSDGYWGRKMLLAVLVTLLSFKHLSTSATTGGRRSATPPPRSGRKASHR